MSPRVRRNRERDADRSEDEAGAVDGEDGAGGEKPPAPRKRRRRAGRGDRGAEAGPSDGDAPSGGGSEPGDGEPEDTSPRAGGDGSRKASTAEARRAPGRKAKRTATRHDDRGDGQRGDRGGGRSLEDGDGAAPRGVLSGTTPGVDGLPDRRVAMGPENLRAILFGDAEPLFEIRTETTVDVGSWFTRAPLWAARFQQELILHAAGRRPYAERIPLADTVDSLYCHVSGGVVIAPGVHARQRFLRLDPLAGRALLKALDPKGTA